MSEETQQPAEQEANNASQAENTATPEEQVEPAAEASAPETRKKLLLPKPKQHQKLTERLHLQSPVILTGMLLSADVDDYSAEDRAS